MTLADFTNAFAAYLAQCKAWSHETLLVLDEVLPATATQHFIDGVKATPSETFLQACYHAKMTLLYTSRLVYPAFLTIVKYILLLLLAALEGLKYLFRWLAPFIKQGVEKGQLAWESLPPRTKAIIFGVMVLLVILYFIGRWIYSLSIIQRTVAAFNRMKKSTSRRYDAFVQSVQQKSAILAKSIPHMILISLFVLIYYFNADLSFFVSFSNQKVPVQLYTYDTKLAPKTIMTEPIGPWVLLPFALLFPFLSSLYVVISTTHFDTDSWRNASRPKIPKNWVRRVEDRFDAEYFRQYAAHFGVENHTFYLSLVQTLLSHVNYYIGLSFCFTLYYLPLIGHGLSYLLNKYHYFPLLLTIWLLNPFTKGGDVIVWALRPILNLLSFIPILNLFVSAAPIDIATTIAATTSTTATANNQSATQETATNTVIQTQAKVSNWLTKLVNLPFIPAFIRTALTDTINEGGLLLAVASLGLVLPFVTDYFALVALFIRPIIASINLTTQLQATTNALFIFHHKDYSNNNNSSNHDKIEHNNDSTVLVDPNTSQTQQQQQTEAQRLSTTPGDTTTRLEQFEKLKKLIHRVAYYILIFMVNICIKLLSKYTPLLSQFPGISNMALAAAIGVQIPVLDVMSLLLKPFVTAIRHVFIPAHFNMTNINTTTTLELLTDKYKINRNWERLYINNHTSNTPYHLLTEQQQQTIAETSSSSTYSDAEQTAMLHFTTTKFHTGIIPTLSTTKQVVISPIVSVMSCFGGQPKRTVKLDDSDLDSDEEDDDQSIIPSNNIPITNTSAPSQLPPPPSTLPQLQHNNTAPDLQPNNNNNNNTTTQEQITYSPPANTHQDNTSASIQQPIENNNATKEDEEDGLEFVSNAKALPSNNIHLKALPSTNIHESPRDVIVQQTPEQSQNDINQKTDGKQSETNDNPVVVSSQPSADFMSQLSPTTH